MNTNYSRMQELGDALSHGRATPADEVSAADFWVHAAEVNAANAGIHVAQAALADAEETTPHTQATLAAAEERHAEAAEALADVHILRAEVGAETGADDVADEPGGHNPLTVAAIYDYLFSDGHAAGLTAEELAEYRSDVALDAEQLAEAGYDVARLAADDAAIEAAAAESEGLTSEGAIAVEDEMLTLAELERAAAEQTAAAAFDAAVNEQLVKHGLPAVEPGATDDALAQLLFDLDQARCARDADDTPEEERHHWSEQVDYLEEQAELAQGASNGAVSPAAPQTVNGAEAEAWGVPDGTPVGELPATYAEWKAEGVEGQDGGDGPHEWSFSDPDETGPVPVEFQSSEELRELAAGDDELASEARAELAGRDDAGKAETPTAAEVAVAEAHAAVEASQQAMSDQAVEFDTSVSAAVDVDE